MKIKWLLQNLNDDENNYLIEILKDNNIKFEIFNYIPHDDIIFKPINDTIYIPYGSTVFINKLKLLNLKELYIPDNSIINNYDILSKNYKDYFLNNDYINYSFEELFKIKLQGEYFFKPSKIPKLFNPSIIDLEFIGKWYNDHSSNNYLFNEQSELVLTSPKNIDYEFRLFIINKDIISGSIYHKYGKLYKSDIIPKEIIEFGYKCIKRYSPLDIYVLDVCIYKNNYYVVELNDINSSGFYKSNILEIINSVNGFLYEKNNLIINKFI